MPTQNSIPQVVIDRAARIARGPHTCPRCDCSTFTEPPIPWTGIRDYVARCDVCERPISVRVDRIKILRRRAMAKNASSSLQHKHDAVTELLDMRGLHAFLMRLIAAAVLPVVVAVASLILNASPLTVFILASIAAIPSAMWGPAVIALANNLVSIQLKRVSTGFCSIFWRKPILSSTIEINAGRWDQWLREEKIRRRERYDDPAAVMRELERVLDTRELRKVKSLSKNGEVPLDCLDDLLRFRRAWVTQ